MREIYHLIVFLACIGMTTCFPCTDNWTTWCNQRTASEERCRNDVSVRTHCQKSCGLCGGGRPTATPTPTTVAACKNVWEKWCNNPRNVDEEKCRTEYVKTNCPKSCGLCGSTTMSTTTMPTTTGMPTEATSTVPPSTPTTTPTTTVKTTSATPTQTTQSTASSFSNPPCEDRNVFCERVTQERCRSDSSARNYCPRTCGVCDGTSSTKTPMSTTMTTTAASTTPASTPKKTTVTPATRSTTSSTTNLPCEDDPTWSMFCPTLNASSEECVPGHDDPYIRRACRKSCGLCGTATTSMTTTTSSSPVVSTVPSDQNTTAAATTQQVSQSTTTAGDTLTVAPQPSTTQPTVAPILSTTQAVVTTTSLDVIDLPSDSRCDTEGHFGRACRFKCNCKDGADCDKVTGACTNGCDQDFWGEHCLLKSKCSYNDGVSCSVTGATMCTGGYYKGKISSTKSKGKCLPWSQFKYQYDDASFADIDGDSASAKDFCRNPGNDDAAVPWCYTSATSPNGKPKWELCDVKPCDCPKYRYGRNCQNECLCYDVDEECDDKGDCPVSGRCWKGVTGPGCQTECDDGKFGINCEYSCHCKDGAACNKTDGGCLDECEEGWSGEACQMGNTAQNEITSCSDNSGGDSYKAVDSDKQSCAVIQWSRTYEKPWWRVDLSHEHVLLNLTLVYGYSSGSGAKFWMTNDKSVPHDMDGNLCASLNEIRYGQGRQTKRVKCSAPVVGRYLHLELLRFYSELRLCDIKILAYPYKDCPYREHGPNCNRKCQCKDDTERCDVITGRCSSSGCNDKYSGENCDINATTVMPETTSAPTTTTVPSTTTTTTTTTTTPSTTPSTSAATSSTTISTTSAPTTTPTISTTPYPVTTTPTTNTRPTPNGNGNLYPWTWANSIKTMKGPACVIPFTFEGEKHHDCVTGSTFPWCPWVHDFNDTSEEYGYCPECRQFKPYPPMNIELTTRPGGIGKRSIVKATWNASSLNHECRFSISYIIQFSAAGSPEAEVRATTEKLYAEWSDAPPNTVVYVAIHSRNCFQAPCDFSENTAQDSITSSEKYAGQVKNMTVMNRTTTSLTLRWEPNEDDGIVSYRVSYDNVSFSNGYRPEVTIRNLKPGTEYEIVVTPVDGLGYGEPAKIPTWTEIADPSPPQHPILVEGKTTPTSISVLLPQATPPKGATIKGYVLKLMEASVCSLLPEKPKEGCCDSDKTREFRPKQSFSFTQRFDVDDVPPKGRMVSLSVDKAKKYTVCFGVVVQGKHGGREKTAFAEMAEIIDDHQRAPIQTGASAGVVVGVVVGALGLIAIVVVIVFAISRRRSKVRPDADVEDVELVQAGRCHSDFFGHLSRHSGQNQALALLGHHIELDEFLECLRVMRNDDGSLYKEEYQLICSGQGSHPTNVARANMAKNRYKNILSYDHSRVLLQRDGPDESDYINASYILDYHSEVAYIATQGPKPNTVSDFWLMVWQQNILEVVMLAREVEEGRLKCHKYWPDLSETESFDCGVTVECLRESDMQSFILRCLRVEKDGVVREIQQFHYTVWPDHGVPTETHSLLAMMKHVGLTPGQAPILVHCSAGVGRTGTFVTIREILRYAIGEGAIDIMKFVIQLRQNRPLMVQTKDQYVFIYDTIGDYLQQRKTAINPYRLHQHYKDLQLPKVARDGFATTGMDEEFEVLHSMTQGIPAKKLRRAVSEGNKTKNRLLEVLPNDDHAVRLNVTGQESDYINAVYVDGYLLEKAFIVTQIPMANTRDDFWKMVNDCGASVLIQMTDDPDPNQTNGSSYLPTADEDITVGSLCIHLVAEEVSQANEEIICRKLQCGPPTQKLGTEVIHYSFVSYPPSPVAVSLILGELDQESQFMAKGPVISLCQDGAGWSGVLCACHHICKQMQLEETVNVLQCIHRIRHSRPQLVWTMAQYEFCYKVALTFLDSFVVYENLRQE